MNEHRLHTVLGRAGSIILLALLISIPTVFALTRPSNQVIYTWESPDSTYRVFLLEQDIDWSRFPFAVQRNYSFLVSPATEPTYGHSIDYPLPIYFAGGGATTAYIREIEVAWAPEGITMTFPSEHVLFVPASAYEQLQRS
jgi:hypothetical protein